MKRILFFIVVLLSITACTKEGTGIIGIWDTNTSDGKLFLELKSGGNGVAYFDGCSSTSAFWSVDGNTLKVIGGAINKDFVKYDFGEGTIVSNDIIRISTTISKAHSSDRTKDLTFTKK